MADCVWQCKASSLHIAFSPPKIPPQSVWGCGRDCCRLALMNCNVCVEYRVVWIPLSPPCSLVLAGQQYRTRGHQSRLSSRLCYEVVTISGGEHIPGSITAWCLLANVDSRHNDWPMDPLTVPRSQYTFSENCRVHICSVLSRQSVLVAGCLAVPGVPASTVTLSGGLPLFSQSVSSHGRHTRPPTPLTAFKVQNLFKYIVFRGNWQNKKLKLTLLISQKWGVLYTPVAVATFVGS